MDIPFVHPLGPLDLVAGGYDLEAPGGEMSVAVGITDLLDEEVLTTHHLP